MTACIDGRKGAFLCVKSLLKDEQFSVQVVSVRDPKEHEKDREYPGALNLKLRGSDETHRALAFGEKAEFVLATLEHAKTAHKVDPDSFDKKTTDEVKLMFGWNHSRDEPFFWSRPYGEGAPFKPMVAEVVLRILARKAARSQTVCVEVRAITDLKDDPEGLEWPNDGRPSLRMRVLDDGSDSTPSDPGK